MIKREDLKLNCMAIGSLPHKDVTQAMKVVEENFSQIPFWPQLAKLNRNEDMIFQFLEALPGLFYDESNDKIFLENESDEFFLALEDLFLDFEEICDDINTESLEKYKISEKNSLTIKKYFELVKKLKPEFAKGQIVGPFTLATTLTDKEGKCAFYDETLREVITKTLILKALWQIKHIKASASGCTPIIFIDEPSISQLGTSAFITISKEEVVEVIKSVSDAIKGQGALSAIHCCGKCDWSIPIEAQVDIINLDGFFFAQNLSLFHEQIAEYLRKDGLIAWGIVPTLDKEALSNATLESLTDKFHEATNYLINKGLDRDLLISHSMVTPSCGAGSLDETLAERAMGLTKALSEKLKEIN